MHSIMKKIGYLGLMSLILLGLMTHSILAEGEEAVETTAVSNGALNQEANQSETRFLVNNSFEVVKGEDYVRRVSFSRNTRHPHYHPSWVYYDWSFYKMSVEGKTVFCLDPETKIPSGLGYVETSDWGYLSHEQQSEIIKTANYGYGFDNDLSDAMHWATQVRIWEIAGWDVSWGTLDASEQYRVIQKRVQNHAIKPQWHQTTLEVNSAGMFDLSDENLSDYANPTTLPMGVRIQERNGNVLKLSVDKTTFKGGTLSMVKSSANRQGVSIVYRKTGEQTFFSAYNEDPVEARVSLRVLNGNIEFWKQDTFGESHSGTVFEISRDAVTVLSNHTTQANGRILIENLSPGTYYYRESRVMAPLILNDEWKVLEVESGKTRTITVINERAQGKIVGIKQSSNQSKISGAIFSIQDQQGNEVDRVESNHEGIFETKNLPLGTYLIIEVFVPAGHVLNPNPTTVNLAYQDQITPIVIATVSLENHYQRANLEIQKTEDNLDIRFPEYHGKALEGVTLSLHASHDIYEGTVLIYQKDALIETKRSDTEGKVIFLNIPLGAYYIKENATIEGYRLQNDVWDVLISADTEKQEQALLEYKTILTNSAIFGSVELVKVNDFGTKRLEGAEFELRRTMDDALIGIYRSDENGRIVVDNLRYSTSGGYYFKETKAPQGYWVNPNRIYFDISDNQETHYTLAPNPLIQVHLMWRKLDEDHKPLAGVGFRIRNLETGQYITMKHQSGKSVIETSIWFSDSQGAVFIEGLLGVGSYVLEEVERPPYLLPIEPMPFVIDEHQNYLDFGELVGLTLDLGDIQNKWVKGDLIIIKKDAKTGARLEGFGFNLYSENGELIDYYETDDKGEIRIKGLRYGLYEVEEVKVKGHYVLSSKHKKQRIKIHEHQVEYTVVFENEKQYGSVHISKKDAKNLQKIEGVSFAIIDISDVINPEYDTLVEMSPYDVQTSNAKGEIQFANLDLDRKWAVIEIGVPFGYVMVKDVYFVDFNQDRLASMAITNKRLKVLIKAEKRDQNTEALLVGGGLELVLKDSAGQIIAPHIIDSMGVHYWLVDALEWYDLSEVNAPKGYTLTNEIYRINTMEETIDHEYRVIIYNQPKLLTLPKTGIAYFNSNYVATWAIAMGVSLLLYRRKKMD